MPSPTDSSNADRIPEERVPGILARAAELDRDRRETHTIDAIREAALDAGISRSAVDAALEEYTTGLASRPVRVKEPDEPKRRSGRVRSFFSRAVSALKTPAKLAGIFFLLGLAGAAGEGMVVIGWAAWLLMTVRLVMKHRPARKAAPLVLGLVAMTVSLALGMAAGEVDEDAVAMLFAVGAPLLVAGSAIIKIRLPRRFRGTAGELEASTG